ncbi:MAG TPA: DUF5663 domain-containing protein [Syntrophobacteraceae bacterium]|nr:DUF5663 domain-containing protein [Syntrophobacteraceae bacterium]
MSEHDGGTFQKQAPSAPIRNPYIMNFLKTLVEKKGERHQPDDLKKLLGDMYRLFESMLGQNMVDALPEDVRKQYLAMVEDLSNLNYEKIGRIFDTNVRNFEQVMKDTMKQFADIYFKNRQFSPGHYKTGLSAED